MHDIKCFERFYLVLERYLMCSGPRIKAELYRQDLINSNMIEVHSKVLKKYKVTKDELKNKKPGDNEDRDLKKEVEKDLYDNLAEKEFLIKLK